MLVVLTLAARAAMAQSLAQPLSRLQQSHWTEREGLPVPSILSIKRSADGYLWLGSVAGLIRFDGARFVAMDSTISPIFVTARGPTYSVAGDDHPEAARRSFAGQTLPLLVDRDGVLWVGPPDGSLVRYRDGVFSVVLRPDPRVGRINAMIQDGAGRMWIVGSREDRVFALEGGRLQQPPLPASVPQSAISGVIRDNENGLWIGVRQGGLWHVAAGVAQQLSPLPGVPLFTTRPLLQTRDGALWVQARGRTYRLSNGRWTQVFTSSPKARAVFPTHVVEMPDGAVVVATRGEGLLRWKAGEVDRFSEEDGLTSASVERLLLDEEGSLWVATDAGLDRFRAAPFTTISTRNGLPLVSPASLQLDGDGAIWVMSSAGTGILQKIDGTRLLEGQAAVLGRAGRVEIDTFFMPFATQPGHGVILLDNHGTMVRQDAGRMSPLGIVGLPAPASARPTGALTARDSSFWLSFRPVGFGVARDGHYTPLPLPELATHGVASFTEDARGHLWIALRDTTLVLELANDCVVRRLDRQSGITEPWQLVAAGAGDTVWGAGAVTGSLFRATRTQVTAYALPSAVRVFLGGAPVLVPREREVWFASSVGIGRVSYATLGQPNAPVRLFDARDGLTAGRLGRMLSGGAVVDRDRRIWFSTLGGLAVVSPEALHVNTRAPRVVIEEMRVRDMPLVRDEHKPLEIPPNAGRLDIHFTAPALLVPERVRIEYQLVGADPSWVDGSAHRVATYTQLSPGTYRFRVRAWNEDGIPATNEASLAFTVLPAWYQTGLFAALGVLGIAGLGSAAAYAQTRARARTREASLRSRFEATLEERTRVAREMHDTVLSGFTGITFQLQALHQTMMESPQQAADTLARVLSSADAALREARETIWDMHSSNGAGDDFLVRLEDTARAAVGTMPPTLRFAVLGERRALGAPIETTLLRATREAVVNAVKHARANVLDVEIEYSADRVHLTVRDDGCGIEATAAATATTDGHWGLSSMKERAQRVGGTLRVHSESGAGTTISMSLPID